MSNDEREAARRHSVFVIRASSFTFFRGEDRIHETKGRIDDPALRSRRWNNDMATQPRPARRIFPDPRSYPLRSRDRVGISTRLLWIDRGRLGHRGNNRQNFPRAVAE